MYWDKNGYTRTTVTAGTPVKYLNSGAVQSVPRHFDWSEYAERYGYESVEVYSMTTCYDCGKTTDAHEVCLNKKCERYKEAPDETPWPMMNYFYPLPSRPDDPEACARALRNLPLCLVHLSEEDEEEAWGLALMGGGMDLSWQICEAYMRLGYLPPTYFDLPMMAERWTTKKAWVLAGAQASTRAARAQLTSRARGLRDVRKWYAANYSA